ncbi:MAG: hypothetical protein COU90_03570 [Candidatus Ryanbacteria bacterium CG10_big_fil_rev_8_21_14_0_10_43_42]|uniref:Uncharacterized protein n=1 Tax=Candidatus Ryanbacteria bacterium CG10_big_fil_rev_8_21_14_0_10_43_42 TaxID=1974864 RepID=A0A2M8KWH8_9BACT|nr:MAG: hypothetical protein COU90_03570 [Candidatus Ryanbacteria bacterium CG10_big_fil_rev_8_21_14_0_10_43_42]
MVAVLAEEAAEIAARAEEKAKPKRLSKATKGKALLIFHHQRFCFVQNRYFLYDLETQYEIK